MTTTKQHKPGCMVNMRCLVNHPDGICPGPYGKCTCDEITTSPPMNPSNIQGCCDKCEKDESNLNEEERFFSCSNPSCSCHSTPPVSDTEDWEEKFVNNFCMIPQMRDNMVVYIRDLLAQEYEKGVARGKAYGYEVGCSEESNRQAEYLEEALAQKEASVIKRVEELCAELRGDPQEFKSQLLRVMWEGYNAALNDLKAKLKGETKK